MIEIPESRTLSRQLREAAIGRKIKSAVAGHSPHGFAWYWGDPAGYADLLRGKRIIDSRATASYVEIEAEDIRILLHDGVNVRYLEKGAARPDKHQLLLEFEDGSGIACTVQMYGAPAKLSAKGLLATEQRMSGLRRNGDAQDLHGWQRLFLPLLSALA